MVRRRDGMGWEERRGEWRAILRSCYIYVYLYIYISMSVCVCWDVLYRIVMHSITLLSITLCCIMIFNISYLLLWCALLNYVWLHYISLWLWCCDSCFSLSACPHFASTLYYITSHHTILYYSVPYRTTLYHNLSQALCLYFPFFPFFSPFFHPLFFLSFLFPFLFPLVNSFNLIFS